tara:strand:- start:6326 stop:8116 length:1791 start_codon:yes stop_codon:yes gene_type:complete
MITLKNIVEEFQTFVDNHFFLKTFSYGSPASVDLDKFTDYPLLHLVYNGSGYDENEKTYSFDLYILDAPPIGVDPAGKDAYEKQAVTSAEQVSEDILADLENGGKIFQFAYGYEIVSSRTVPLMEQTSGVLTGVLFSLSIATPYLYDACNAPLTGSTPGGSATPSSSVTGVLRVREVDGSPNVANVDTIIVTNGTLTDDGSGVVTLDTGGGGAVDSVNGEIGVVVLDTDDIAEGSANKYMVLGTSGTTALAGNTTTITGGQASEITANTAKVGITAGQATEIADNTLKVGITGGQASEISANTLKTGITSGQATDITTNNAKVGITPTQASDIVTNNAKVGITAGQATEIADNTLKVGYTDGAVDTRIGLADLDDLADVVITSATTGEVLKWSGSNWVNGTGGTGSGTLAGLTDVDVTGVVDNNTLVYDSATSKWVDGYPTTSGVVSSADFTGTKTYTIGAGSGKVDIGSFDALDFSFDFSMRGSNSFGSTETSSAFRSTALNMGSSYRIQGIFEVTASAVGTLFGMSIANPSGYYLTQLLFMDTAPDTTTRDVTFDTGAQTASRYEYVNTFEFGWIATANVDYKLKSFTLTFTNA